MPSSTRFLPGDLITSSLINSILDRLDALEGKAPITLGPLATGTHTMVALSSGFEGTSGIWLDGTLLLSGTRGINLVILDFQTLQVKYASSYDTYGNPDESSRLASDLRSRTSRYAVVVSVT